jgi:hypothetical protein
MVNKYKILILQVLHDCRQFVSWDVWLIPLTDGTLNFNYLLIIYIKIFICIKSFKVTDNYKLEEGENEVKSMWPLWIGLHMCYNENYKK